MQDFYLFFPFWCGERKGMGGSRKTCAAGEDAPGQSLFVCMYLRLLLVCYLRLCYIWVRNPSPL